MDEVATCEQPAASIVDDADKHCRNQRRNIGRNTGFRLAIGNKEKCSFGILAGFVERYITREKTSAEDHAVAVQIRHGCDSNQAGSQRQTAWRPECYLNKTLRAAMSRSKELGVLPLNR